ILKAKLPEPGGGSTVEAEGIPRHYLDATTGDIQWNLDWRASLSARLRHEQKISESNNGRCKFHSREPAKTKRPTEASPATRTGLASHWRLVPTVRIEPWCWPEFFPIQTSHFPSKPLLALRLPPRRQAALGFAPPPAGLPECEFRRFFSTPCSGRPPCRQNHLPSPDSGAGIRPDAVRSICGRHSSSAADWPRCAIAPWSATIVAPESCCPARRSIHATGDESDPLPRR